LEAFGGSLGTRGPFLGGFCAPLTPPKYSFSASFLEIYNEVVGVLLGGDKGGELEVSCGEQAIKELVKYILN